jgi:hypothetical protein
MHDILKTPVIPFVERLPLEIRGGIPSAEAAARLKFGLEALPEVDHVYFVADGIEVMMVDTGEAAMESVWKGLAEAGFAEGIARSRDGACSSPAGDGQM